MGLSLKQMAAMAGVATQQAHKYETGVNRIAVGTLLVISEALQVPVEYFFEGLSPDGAEPEQGPRQRLLLEMMRNFMLIEDEVQQKALVQMSHAMLGMGRLHGSRDE